MLKKLKNNEEGRELYRRLVRKFRNSEVTDHTIDRILGNPDTWLHVSMEQNEITGYVLSYVLPRMDSESDMLMIYYCYVDPAYQRRHIAESMMKEVFDEAKRQEIYYTFLITQKDNAAACALYDKLDGMANTRNNTVYYWFGTGSPNI